MDVVVGWAALWGCECEAGGEFVCAALAVAGGVEMPFVSGAGDAMVVWLCGWLGEWWSCEVEVAFALRYATQSRSQDPG